MAWPAGSKPPSKTAWQWASTACAASCAKHSWGRARPVAWTAGPSAAVASRVGSTPQIATLPKHGTLRVPQGLGQRQGNASARQASSRPTRPNRLRLPCAALNAAPTPPKDNGNCAMAQAGSGLPSRPSKFRGAARCRLVVVALEVGGPNRLRLPCAALNAAPTPPRTAQWRRLGRDCRHAQASSGVRRGAASLSLPSRLGALGGRDGSLPATPRKGQGPRQPRRPARKGCRRVARQWGQLLAVAAQGALAASLASLPPDAGDAAAGAPPQGDVVCDAGWAPDS